MVPDRFRKLCVLKGSTKLWRKKELEGVGRRGLMETEITFKELQQQGVFENEKEDQIPI